MAAVREPDSLKFIDQRSDWLGNMGESPNQLLHVPHLVDYPAGNETVGRAFYRSTDRIDLNVVSSNTHICTSALSLKVIHLTPTRYASDENVGCEAIISLTLDTCVNLAGCGQSLRKSLDNHTFLITPLLRMQSSNEPPLDCLTHAANNVDLADRNRLACGQVQKQPDGHLPHFKSVEAALVEHQSRRLDCARVDLLCLEFPFGIMPKEFIRKIAPRTKPLADNSRIILQH